MTQTQKTQLKAKINDVRASVTELAPTPELAEAANSHLAALEADIETWRVETDEPHLSKNAPKRSPASR